jgi:hypothetical protein
MKSVFHIAGLILLLHILTIQYAWEDDIERPCCGAEIQHLSAVHYNCYNKGTDSQADHSATIEI